MSKRSKPFPTHIVVFLAPATIIYTIFMIYPLIDSLRLSLYTPDDILGARFIGLQNYITLMTDELLSVRFWGALRNNFLFFFVHMLLQNPIGLFLATLLSNQKLRFSNTYRTILFMPTMLSVVIIGFIWQLILSPIWGIAQSLMAFVGLGQYFQPWLGLESSALLTLSFISVWQFVGIPMMLFYAALLGIPDEMIEAAHIDGATPWQVFWQIKFPLLLPTVGIVSILTFVGNFNAFDLIYSTQGALAGPNFSTDIMGTLFYRTFFGFQLQPPNPTMGATIAGMMFFIILLGVLGYILGFQRRIENYQL